MKSAGLIFFSVTALQFLNPPNGLTQEEVTVSGYVRDVANGEALIYANIFLKNTNRGTTSNQYGFYSLDVPLGQDVVMVVSYIGYQNWQKPLILLEDLFVSAEMSPADKFGEEIVIESAENPLDERLSSTEMSVIRIPIHQIRDVPSFGGESDLIKVAQLLPGVSRGGEGTTGIFVRGGDADQNLVVLDEAVVYNISHAFGFFSVFNSDAIKDVTMVKGAFPAYYGGRLSSVLDVRMREGDSKSFGAEGGIGLLSSRMTFEGPIVKEKASFLLSGRRTYIDQVFKVAGSALPYYFYDLNAKVNFEISENDRIFFSGYFGEDVLELKDQVKQEDGDGGDEPFEGGELRFGFNVGNFTQTLRWNHVFGPKLFSNLSLIHTSFDYDIKGEFLDNSVLVKSSIRDLGGKLDFHYYRSDLQDYQFGVAVTNHDFRPNIISTSGEISEELASREGRLQNNQEIGVYGNARYDLPEQSLRADVGIRISGSVVPGKVYMAPEPRVSFRYRVSDQSALKTGYSKMYQYMHRLSSSSVALPTDLWYPVSKAVKPQSSDQFVLGYEHLLEPTTLMSLEVYYKSMNNLIEYREGTNLLFNDNFEKKLIQGNGESYGLELLVKKDEGRLTGWIGYTLSWSTRTFDDTRGGDRFWARYDRRHNIGLVSTYKLNKRWTFATIWEYASGSWFTPLIGQYFVPNAALTSIDVIPVFSEKNDVRLSASHRLDVSFVRRTNQKGRFKREWHFGVYNFYNRAAPYLVEVTPDGTGGYKYTQPGLFGAIPYISFNFRF